VYVEDIVAVERIYLDAPEAIGETAQTIGRTRHAIDEVTYRAVADRRVEQTRRARVDKTVGIENVDLHAIKRAAENAACIGIGIDDAVAVTVCVAADNVYAAVGAADAYSASSAGSRRLGRGCGGGALLFGGAAVSDGGALLPPPEGVPNA
jgi:hypothetical protein